MFDQSLMIITLLIAVSYAKLNGLRCNGVETERNSVAIAIPAGICHKGLTSSYILQCAEHNEMYYYLYESMDCTGYSKQILAADVYSSEKYDDSNIVCGMDSCHYISITTYNTSLLQHSHDTNCVDSTDNNLSISVYTMATYVLNYCNSIRGRGVMWTCNKYAHEQVFYQNENCVSSEQHNIMTYNYHLNQDLCKNDADIFRQEPSDNNHKLINIECGIADSHLGSDMFRSTQSESQSQSTTSTSFISITSTASATNSLISTVALSIPLSKSSNLMVVICITVILVVTAVIVTISWVMWRKQMKSSVAFTRMNDDNVILINE